MIDLKILSGFSKHLRLAKKTELELKHRQDYLFNIIVFEYEDPNTYPSLVTSSIKNQINTQEKEASTTIFIFY